MKKKHFKMILIWILTGILIGSLIGVIGVFGLIPTEHFLQVTNLIITLCIGVIVLLIDCLCIWALIRPAITNRIDRNGAKAIGKIENITVIPRPDQIDEDHWIQKARFALIVSYEVGAQKYSKEFSPTCLTSRQELYPQVIDVGEKIPVKYSERFPRFSLLDVNVLKAGLKKEQKGSKVYFIMIPIVITLVYVLIVL